MNGKSPSGLDHFYTNHPEKLSVVQSHFCGGSDHRLILATRYSKEIKKNVRYIYKRSYKNFCLSDFLCDLAKISWWEVYKSADVNFAVEFFTENFLGVLDLHAPMKTIQTRTKYAPWLSESTKRLISKRNEIQKVAALNPNSESWNKFKKLRNEVTKKLRLEQKTWQKESLSKCEGSSRDQWQHILGWLDWKNCGSPTQLFYEGKLINKPSEIADAQNEYFINKVGLIQQKLPHSGSDPLAILKRLMQ